MYVRTLSTELQEIAKKELNEDSNRIQDNLNHIRDWLKKQSYLKARNDDQWLLCFLRNAKFSLEKAKEKIDRYYTMRSIAPELYERNPLSSELQEILKRGIFSVIIDKSKPSLPAVTILRWHRADPERISILNILKVYVMLLDIIMIENDNVVISGMHFLGDLKGIPVAYLPHFTPSFCKKFVMSMQDVNPLRLNSMHAINVPSYFEAILNLSKAFMKEKMKNRLHVYGANYQALYEHIPPSLIPKDYGGEACYLDEITDDLKKKVESYRSWFLDDAQYGTDEAKRPGKPKLASDVFGVEGSFRKLNID